MILVDTNVILDVVQDDHSWAEWSQAQLDAASLRGDLAINEIVYAQLSIAFARIEELEALLDQAALKLLPLPREALFLAGKALLSYRRKGGTRTGVLPDLFIGAQAAVLRLPLLTRDATRYKTYFPSIDLICP